MNTNINLIKSLHSLRNIIPNGSIFFMIKVDQVRVQNYIARRFIEYQKLINTPNLK